MLVLIPQLAFTGFLISFYTGLLTPIIMLMFTSEVSIKHQQALALYAMVALGFGECIGAVI